MQLVGTEVGIRFSAAGYSFSKLLARRTGCGLLVGFGWRCVVQPEFLVLLYLCRYFCPEGFRLAGENEVLGLLDLIDVLYLRYDGVKGADVAFRGCVVACPSLDWVGPCPGHGGDCCGCL